MPDKIPAPENPGSPSRRDLLRGLRPEESKANDIPLEFGPLFHFSANAMGCEFQILCSEDGREPLAASITEAFELVNRLEQQLSIYRESSEMTAINRLAFESDIPVEPALFGLLRTAEQIRLASKGAFDITSTPLSLLWKSSRQQRTLPDLKSIDDALALVDGGSIRLEESNQTVRFGKNGIAIDLGGIGKGFALDRLREYLIRCGCENFLIHGGQSSVITSGQRTTLDGNESGPWQVGISHPLTPGFRLATLTLQDQAIGTSGSGRQSFVVDGKRYGHIIDPRTGWPADHFLSVTVIASTAFLADALATAIFVAGPERATEISEAYNVSAVLVSSGEDNSMQINSIGNPQLTMHDS